MMTETKNKLQDYAKTLSGSPERAHCIHIANLNLSGRTIAETLLADHISADHAARHARACMEPAGAAIRKSNKFGDFDFDDGSNLLDTHIDQLAQQIKAKN